MTAEEQADSIDLWRREQQAALERTQAPQSAPATESDAPTIRFKSLGDLVKQLDAIPRGSGGVAPSLLSACLKALAKEVSELVQTQQEQTRQFIDEQRQFIAEQIKIYRNQFNDAHRSELRAKNETIVALREKNDFLAWQLSELFGKKAPSAKLYHQSNGRDAPAGPGASDDGL